MMAREAHGLGLYRGHSSPVTESHQIKVLSAFVVCSVKPAFGLWQLEVTVLKKKMCFLQR